MIGVWLCRARFFAGVTAPNCSTADAALPTREFADFVEAMERYREKRMEQEQRLFEMIERNHQDMHIQVGRLKDLIIVDLKTNGQK